MLHEEMTFPPANTPTTTPLQKTEMQEVPQPQPQPQPQQPTPTPTTAGDKQLLLSETDLQELFGQIKVLNEAKSSQLQGIVESVHKAFRALNQYKCCFCDNSFLDRSLRDQHIVAAHEEAIQCFQMNVKMLSLRAKELFTKVPDLPVSINKISTGAGTVAANADITSLRSFYFDCRLALEMIVTNLLRSFGVHEMDPSARLEEMLVKLKSMITPPSRMNSFFQMKTLVGSAIHEIVQISDSVDLKRADTMMMYFRNVVEESILLFEEGPIIPPQTAHSPEKERRAFNDRSAPGDRYGGGDRYERSYDRYGGGDRERFVDSQRPPVRRQGSNPPRGPPSRVNDTGDLYKTQLCNNWKRDRVCPLGAKCKFAHGESELRKARCAFFAQGNCKMPDCKFAHY